MPEPGYESIDAGDGRRLERFGAVLVDRPAPAALGPRQRSAPWAVADARFDRDGRPGAWLVRSPIPDPWRFRAEHPALELDLRLAGAGQVGVFPEQHVLWRSIASAVRSWRPVDGAGDGPAGDEAGGGRRPAVLSLFAYPGAATLAAAAAGASAVHVDGSRTAVDWARRNAELSGLAQAAIRWLVDDVPSFVAREGRRGHRYEGVVLDPPTYGHGAGSRAWRIERDLEPLLDALAAVLSPTPAFVGLSAHKLDLDPDRLAGLLGRFGAGDVARGELVFLATSGSRFGLGAYAFWTPS